MRRGRAYLIIFIACMISAILVATLYHFQRTYFMKQNETIVVAPAKLIPVGQVIREQDLKRISISKHQNRSEMFQQVSDVEGMTAAVTLGKNEPILAWKIGKDLALPHSGEATFQIPKSYIFSLSNEIRSGDYVNIYLSSPNGVSEKLFDESVVVHSVKTAANHEVIDVLDVPLTEAFKSNEMALRKSRKNANGLIEYINLNLSEQQWLNIDRFCKTGSSRIAIARAEDSDYLVEME